jgi:hypothetical protein
VNDVLINGSDNFCEPYDELKIMDILWDYHICLLILYDVYFTAHADMIRTFKRKSKLKIDYDEHATENQYSVLGLNHNIESEYCLYAFEY